MSSIGEGIDFSQEQQKISGMYCRISRAHGPWRPSTPVPLVPKVDPQGREVSLRPRCLHSAAPCPDSPARCPLWSHVSFYISKENVCKLHFSLPLQKLFFLMSSRHSFLS